MKCPERSVLSCIVLLSLLAATTAIAQPIVYIYSPTNGSTFLAPANITVNARAFENHGVVQQVAFYAGDHLLGAVTNSNPVATNTSSTYVLGWSNVLAGSYPLKAVATDTHGLMSTSAVVTVSVVTNLPPSHPTVYIYSPANGSTFLAPANITINAHAFESNGVVQQVAFYAGNHLLGAVTNSNPVATNTSSTYVLGWSNVLAGSYPLKAVATDTHGLMSTSAVVTVSVVTNLPVLRPSVYIYYPSNGSTFVAPTNLTLYARAVETTGTVATVQFLAGSTSLGVVSNSSQVVVTNLSKEPLFPLAWSNVLAGSYALKAIATDAHGITSTSTVVNITVITNRPPPPIPFIVSFWYPANGQTFTAPANIGVHALVVDSNVVRTVQYFSGDSSIGIVTNTGGVWLTNTGAANPFFLLWSNVPAGHYTLTAVARDSAGLSATSAPVSITVTSLPPPVVHPSVYIYSPANGASYVAPASLTIYARAVESTGTVQTVQFFAGSTSLGVVSNSSQVVVTNLSKEPLFPLAWSNVLAGHYALKAIATDALGMTATSSVVSISVVTNLPPPPTTNHPAVVRIYAPDPVAIEGTNGAGWFPVSTNSGPYTGGTNTATFLVQRDGPTNGELTVYYTIEGSATNGVDYATIPNHVTIPAGQTYSLLTILPLSDADSAFRPYDTVVLGLVAPTNASGATAPYEVGSPQKAAVLILEETFMPLGQPLIATRPGNCIQVSFPATNGMNFCLQISTNFVDWVPVLTNTVVKGSVQYIEPDATAQSRVFYRAVPVDAPPSY